MLPYLISASKICHMYFISYHFKLRSVLGICSLYAMIANNDLMWFFDSCIYSFFGYTRADSRFAPRQWKTSLQSSTVSHWMGAHLESALQSTVWCTVGGKLCYTRVCYLPMFSFCADGICVIHQNTVMYHWHLGLFHYHGLTLTPVRISNYIHYKLLVKLFTHFQAVKVWELLSDFILSYHTLLGMWLLFHAGSKFNQFLVKKKSPPVVPQDVSFTHRVYLNHFV